MVALSCLPWSQEYTNASPCLQYTWCKSLHSLCGDRMVTLPKEVYVLILESVNMLPCLTWQKRLGRFNKVSQRDQVQSLGQESAGGGYGNPLQYSCLENPMDGRAWRATVHGVTKSWTQLSDWSGTHHSGLFPTISSASLTSLCLLSVVIPNRGLLKSSTVIVHLSIYPCHSVSFCSAYFDAVSWTNLWFVWPFGGLSLYCYVISHFIPISAICPTFNLDSY